MQTSIFDTKPLEPALQAHLMGVVDFDRCVKLQRRLVKKTARAADGDATLLLCEHSPMITVGRGGRPEEIARGSRAIRDGQYPIKWVGRGGGALVHGPGQIALYPIVPIGWHEISIGRFFERLRSAIIRTFSQLNVPVQTDDTTADLLGRTGRLATFGLAVRRGVSYFGAYINVAMSPGALRLIESPTSKSLRLSCIQAEHRGRYSLSQVRAILVESLAAELDFTRFHLYTGHPMLKSESETRRPMGMA